MPHLGHIPFAVRDLFKKTKKKSVFGSAGEALRIADMSALQNIWPITCAKKKEKL